MSAAERVLPLDRLLEQLARRRSSGATVALANGLFDILHIGHLRYLEAAREEADLLAKFGEDYDAYRSKVRRWI